MRLPSVWQQDLRALGPSDSISSVSGSNTAGFGASPSPGVASIDDLRNVYNNTPGLLQQQGMKAIQENMGIAAMTGPGNFYNVQNTRAAFTLVDGPPLGRQGLVSAPALNRPGE